MKHSKTPWSIEKPDYEDQIVCEDLDIATMCSFNDHNCNLKQKANAKHIVKCVNMHDELIKLIDEIVKEEWVCGSREDDLKAILKKAGKDV